MEECLKRTGMAFLYAPLLHPAMRFVMPVRQQLGIRTVFNILGPLCNPAGIKRYVMGVYDNKLCWKMAEACKGLGFDHSLIVHGEEGLDELSITGPSYICELKDKNVLEYKLGPEELGFELGRLSDLRGGTPEKNARIIKSILNGQSTSGAKYDVVLLNAAAAIYIGAKADCWEYAIEKARESIESGSAYKKYREFAEFTQAL
jgi:anthranilate phosphoribosyltransferase